MCKNKTGCVILIGLWVTFLIFFSFSLFEIVNFQYQNLHRGKVILPKGNKSVSTGWFSICLFPSYKKNGMNSKPQSESVGN